MIFKHWLLHCSPLQAQLNSIPLVDALCDGKGQAVATSCCRSTLALLTSVSFILGALCSGMAGYVGMWVSVRANVRVAGGARRSAREALQIALRAGGFSGLVVVGMVSWAACKEGIWWPVCGYHLQMAGGICQAAMACGLEASRGWLLWA